MWVTLISFRARISSSRTYTSAPRSWMEFTPSTLPVYCKKNNFSNIFWGNFWSVLLFQVVLQLYLKVCPNYTWKITFFQLNVKMEGVNSIHDLGILTYTLQRNIFFCPAKCIHLFNHLLNPRNALHLLLKRPIQAVFLPSCVRPLTVIGLRHYFQLPSKQFLAHSFTLIISLHIIFSIS